MADGLAAPAAGVRQEAFYEEGYQPSQGPLAFVLQLPHNRQVGRAGGGVGGGGTQGGTFALGPPQRRPGNGQVRSGRALNGGGGGRPGTLWMAQGGARW